MQHLEISISGSIQKNNFDSWKLGLLEQIASTNLDLETDNDFAIASDNAKSLKTAEKTLKECKFKALELTHDIQKLFSAIDEVTETARETRLILERQVRTKKQQIKSDLVTKAQLKILDYCKSKSEIFSYVDQKPFTAVSGLEAVIKGKASLTGVEKALDIQVQELMQKIDAQEKLAQESYQFISNQSDLHRVLLQDIQYLLSLPLPELKLTVENRIVKLSEQQALKVASSESVHGSCSQTISNYVISIEVSSTRSEVIEIAREVKQYLISRSQVTDIKLNKQRDYEL